MLKPICLRGSRLDGNLNVLGKCVLLLDITHNSLIVNTPDKNESETKSGIDWTFSMSQGHLAHSCDLQRNEILVHLMIRIV